MTKKPETLSVSEARERLTTLDQILKPGETLEITRHDKKYVRVELLGETTIGQRVLDSIQSLPKPKGASKNVARNYKKHLYGGK